MVLIDETTIIKQISDLNCPIAYDEKYKVKHWFCYCDVDKINTVGTLDITDLFSAGSPDCIVLYGSDSNILNLYKFLEENVSKISDEIVFPIVSMFSIDNKNDISILAITTALELTIEFNKKQKNFIKKSCKQYNCNFLNYEYTHFGVNDITVVEILKEIKTINSVQI